MVEKMSEEKSVKTSKKTEEMAKAGLHFGQAVSKRHPNMDPYIEGVKGSVHIINLATTEEKLAECIEYLKKFKKEGKTIMLVSTKPEFRKIVRDVAKETGMPYVVSRFLGGMMTNFATMKKRIDYYNDILEKQDSGELERKYTKQERVKISKELEGLEKKFEGVREMERIPDAIFVIDMIKDKLAIKEAKMCNVTVIAIADTNSDPTLADYFIPANDDSITSVEYILDKVKKALK
jgi:small subunit ribosomal protein S2